MYALIVSAILRLLDGISLPSMCEVWALRCDSLQAQSLRCQNNKPDAQCMNRFDIGYDIWGL